MKKIIAITICATITLIGWMNVVKNTSYVKISPIDEVPDYVKGHESEFLINPETKDIHSKGSEDMDFFLAMIGSLAAIVGIPYALTYIKDSKD